MKKILFLLSASLLLGTSLSALAIEPPYPEGPSATVGNLPHSSRVIIAIVQR